MEDGIRLGQVSGCQPALENRQRKCRQVLLKLDVLVNRQKCAKFLACLSEQSTVAQTGPAHLECRAHLVSSKQAAESPQDTMVEQQLLNSLRDSPSEKAVRVIPFFRLVEIQAVQPALF